MNFDNNIPIYIQLVEQIKKDIISGKLNPGEKLLSVREFALQMKVNPNTVQKAFVELEELKLIYTERTNGKFVTTNKNLINRYKKEFVDELTKKYLSSMKDIGFDKKGTIEQIKEWEEINNEFVRM